MATTYPRRMTALVFGGTFAVLFLWLAGTPAGPMGKAVAVGYAICHRIAERSFLIDLDPMPLCARCTGIYLGVLLGVLLASARGRLRAVGLPPWPVLLVLAGFASIMAVDGLNSYIQLFPNTPELYAPRNTLRLFTGLGFGLALIHVLLPLFNRTVWATPTQNRILGGLPDLLLVVVLAVVVGLLVLAERPLLAWVLGMASALGVVLTLALVGCGFFMAVNRLAPAPSWRGLALPLLAGLGLAVGQLGLIALARFAFTGTWDGFVLG
jgi:uncharacterized membrane protein